MKGFLLSPGEIGQYLENSSETIQEKSQLLDSLSREKRRLEQEIDRLFSLHTDGEIPTQGFGKRYQPLQEQLNQIEEQFPEIESTIDFLKVNLLSRDQVLYEARSLAERWGKLDLQQRRTIVETITERIVIGKDDVTIDLWYLPVPFELMTKRQRDVPVALFTNGMWSPLLWRGLLTAPSARPRSGLHHHTRARRPCSPPCTLFL